jgi:antirestriction protein
MSSQAVMKRQILALAKREPSNEELQKIKQSLAVYKTLTKEEQFKINEMVKDAHAKLESEGKFAKGGTTKTQSLKTALTDLKNKVGVKKFKRATTGTDIKKDIGIPAQKVGKRIVRKKGKTTNQYGTFKNQVGTTYYESRSNRSDVNQPSEKRKIKLADGGTTTSLSSIKRKYYKNEDENAHSENVVLLAKHFGDAEDLKLAKQILARHNEEGSLSSENGKQRNELHLKLIEKARVKFGEEGIEFAKGGELVANYEIELFWKGLSGNDRKIGKYVVSYKTLDKIEEDWKSDISVDVIDDSSSKPISYAELKNEITNLGKQKFGKASNEFAKGGEVSQYIDGLSKQEVLSKTIVYDNGGESYDRYTIFTPDGSVYGMSETAEGFNQYIGDSSEIEQGKHLGKKLRSIPKGIQGAVLDRMLDDEQMFAKGGKLSKEDALQKAIDMGVDFDKDFHAQSVGNELAELAKESGYKKSPSSSGSTGRAFFYHLQKIYDKKKFANGGAVSSQKIYEVEYEIGGKKHTSQFLMYDSDRVENLLPPATKIISIKEKFADGGAMGIASYRNHKVGDFVEVWGYGGKTKLMKIVGFEDGKEIYLLESEDGKSKSVTPKKYIANLSGEFPFLSSSEKHKQTMRNAPFDENTYPKGTEFADGGLTTFSKSVNNNTIAELQGKFGGVTIKKMGDLLEQMFPDSFGFDLYEIKDTNQRKSLIPSDFKGIKDDKLKVYFDSNHSMDFRVYQGGENTYFYFGLTSEDKEYIGTFGFKDEGDVESEYVTSFIAFLCKMYGFPFQVNHSVYAQGGTIKKSLAEFKNKVGASKYREATRGVDIKADLQIPALKKGKRVVTTKGKTSNQYGTFKNKVGSVYYENRPNHYDVNQPSEKRKIKLAQGGKIGSSLAKKVKHINDKYDGVVASKTERDNRIQVKSPFFNTLNEIKKNEFGGNGLLQKDVNSNAYVLYSNAIFAQGGTFADGGVLEGAKIYVADLAEYNDGRLVGKWFDLSDYSDASELMVAIQEMLDEQTAKDKHGEVHEEWAVHDFEGFPRSFYSEYMGEKDFEKLYQIAEVANDRGLPIDVLMEAVADFGADEDEIERIAEAYYTSIPASMGNESRDFAYEYIDSIGSITDAVSNPDFYFDYESFGSDARMDYTDEELEEYGYDELDDTELGERLVDEMGGIEQLGNKTIEMYFDYDKFGRDLEYDFTAVRGDDGNFYYFSSNW